MIDIGEGGWQGVIQRFLIDVRQVFTAPSSDPLLTIVVFSILLIFLIALILIFVSVYLFITRGRRVRFWARIEISRRDIWIGRIFFGLFLITLFVIGTYYTENQKNCMNCHPPELEKKALEKTAHKGITCIRCHKTPGVAGYFRQKIDFLRWVTVYFPERKVPKPGRMDAFVADSACLSCHSDVIEKNTQKYNLIVRHKEIENSSYVCTDCHSEVAHGQLSKPIRKPEMDKCMKCHNGKLASRTCQTCHPEDVGKGITEPIKKTPKVGINYGAYKCYGLCHNEKKECIYCHGVSMPHPRGWADRRPYPEHIKYAGFTGKKICWRCHYPEGKPLERNPGFCAKCHQIGFHGKDEDVFYSHQAFTAGQCGICHGRDFCNEICHGPQEPDQPLPPKVRNAPFGFPEGYDL